ncbi:Piso0_002420 [Millerozyma farinosa CBS 7064]|uniref:Mitochondrial fission 1 protein n=1 Tax=Pichia sorbitophila (strain ATCC MYA-4447 / BCRC 22081 / CBS 7064 / NBRC 10061 / NRRL Y-12695) TaxID=559304 RepID=G8YCK1_PICSO|nr:Piso0_002420 [Millerozyma farinosa CBS 7064]
MFGKSNKYPVLQEVQEPLSAEQLRVLRNQVDSEKPNPVPQSLFNYAWGLIKSNNSQYQLDGIKILEELYLNNEEMRRECLYYLALASFKIGSYSNARRYTEVLLEGEPDNSQFKSLKESVDDKVTQEGLIGLGMAGGILALGVGIIGGLMRKKR